MNQRELILVLVLVLAVVVTNLLLRNSIRRSARPATFRFRVAIIALILVPVALVLHLVMWTGDLGRRDWFLLACFLVMFVWFLREVIRLRPLAQQEPRHLWRARPPSFTWQAGLILLPLVGLSVLGLLAVRRDFVLTEEEARQQATEIARVFAERLSRSLPVELSNQELLGNRWHGMGIIGGRVPWPETNPLTADEIERYQQQLVAWRTDHPGLHPEDVFPVQTTLSVSGELLLPRPYENPPSPARWLIDLSPDHWTAMSGVAQSIATTPDDPATRSAVAEFLATDPPRPVRANVEFALLLGELNRHTPEDRVNHLIAFARKHGTVQGESGLPLGSLALVQALREAGATGLTRQLFEALRDQCYDQPSLLIPRLLDDAERLATQESADVATAVAELRNRWAAHDRLRTLARHIVTALGTDGIITRNLWLDVGTNRWLAIVQPGVLQVGSVETGRAVTESKRVIKARFHPKPIVRGALDRILTDVAVTMPDYLALEIHLANEPLLGMLPRTEQSQPSVVLAQSRIELSLTGRFLDPDRSRGEFIEHETLPSRPELALAIHLVDPQRLYALARQRAVTMGGITLSAALVAMIGLAAAWRSFQRQLRLNEMKSSFVSSVSHELRAPIASIRLMAESLERGKIAATERQHDYFRIIGQECRRLSSLIENVLDFSRIDQGRQRYELEPTDVAALIGQTLELMQPYATARTVNLITAEPQSARSDVAGTNQPQLSVDSRALQQALINLIDNAVKHSPPGGLVTVGWELDPDPASNPATPHRSGDYDNDAGRNPGQPSVRIWVQDQGPGIPACDHERIFEPFLRLGSELERETPGTGIGLSIVKHVVDAHHGRVWVESSPGQGSRFTIEIPI